MQAVDATTTLGTKSMDHPAPALHLADDAGGREVTDSQGTLTYDELLRMNAYWRAANYLSVGQIYLFDNPLLHERLTLAHVKPLVVGHWGTTPARTSSTSISTGSSKAVTWT